MALRTDYQDAMFDGKRKYRLVENDDSTVSFADATTYTQEGDRFGANDINETNTEVNRVANELGNKAPAFIDMSEYTLEEIIGNHPYNSIPFMFGIAYNSGIAPDNNDCVCITVNGTIYAFSYSGKIFKISENAEWEDITAKHTHDASDINSGTLPVSRGGTGATSFTSGQLLIGNGANAVTGRGVTNNTSAAMCSGTYIPTCNTVAQHVAAVLNRNNCVHNAGTAYTTYMARGIALVTSAPSSLANGCCAFVYQ